MACSTTSLRTDVAMEARGSSANTRWKTYVGIAGHVARSQRTAPAPTPAFSEAASTDAETWSTYLSDAITYSIPLLRASLPWPSNFPCEAPQIPAEGACCSSVAQAPSDKSAATGCYPQPSAPIAAQGMHMV